MSVQVGDWVRLIYACGPGNKWSGKNALVVHRARDAVTVVWPAVRWGMSPAKTTHWANFLEKLTPEELAAHQLASGRAGAL